MECINLICSSRLHWVTMDMAGESKELASGDRRTMPSTKGDEIIGRVSNPIVPEKNTASYPDQRIRQKFYGFYPIRLPRISVASD